MGIVQEVKDVARFEHIGAILLKQGLNFVGKKSFIPSPPKLRRILEELGATFVKLGQLLSLRPDLIPREYCDEFRKLQDHVAPFPFSDVRQVVEAELKQPVTKLFAHIDEKPLASASVGQVHRARLKNGLVIAVKVQRPGIHKTFQTDIDIMMHFAPWLEKHVHGIFDPYTVLEEFKKYTQRELDFQNEARNIDQLYRNFSNSKTVRIPRVLWSHTSSRVLTLELIDGKSVNTTTLRTMQDRRLFVRNLVDCMFQQIFVDGFFHADPHAGNLMVLPHHRIGLLDFGIVGILDEDIREKMTQLCIAVIEGDVKMIAESLCALGFVEQCNRDLERDIRLELSQYYGASLEQINLSEAFQKVLMIARRDHVHLPSDFVLLVKAVVTLEGVARDLDPECHVMDIIRPHAKRLMRERYLSVRTARKQLLSSSMEYLHLFRTFPTQFSNVLKKLQEGKLHIQMQDTDIHYLTVEMERSSYRLAYAIITGTMIMASALLWYAGIGPLFRGIPIIALIGFVCAAFFALLLVIALMRR